MKLLFDQNISFRLVRKLSSIFPEAKHVSDVGLKDADDPEIWVFSRKHDYVVVTFDSDFFEMSILKGAPPKIIWMRTGNVTTDQILDLFRRHENRIKDFVSSKQSPQSVCLELFG